MDFFYTYRRWLILSASVHVLVLLFVLFINKARFLRPVLLGSGVGGSSINVDVVGLPNVLKKDIDSMNELEAQQEEASTPDKDKMALDNNEKSLKDKKNLIQRLRQSIQSRDNYLKKIDVIKGMKASKSAGKGSGEGPGTGAGNGDGPSVNPYFTTIKDLVRTYWQVPTWLKSEGLNTEITIRIGINGELTDIQVTKTSGNTDFDKLAYQAVKNSSPFTPPPPSVKDLVDNGVVLSFP